MPLLKFAEVLAFSSEDPNHPVDNLLKPDSYLKWKSKPDHRDKQEYAILKLGKLSSIQSIDIGNEHSSFVEVLVSRDGSEYEVLLVASSFMTPLESRNSTSTNRVRMFGLDKLNKNIAEQKWDRVKVVCTQPFNKNIQYGLAFFKVHSAENKESSTPSSKLGLFTIKDDDTDDPITIGSFFEKRKEKESPLFGAAAIRAASKEAQTPNNKKLKRAAEDSPNAPEMGFYQLKKKTKDLASPTPKTTPNEAKAKKEEKPRDVRELTINQQRPSKPFNKLMDDVVFVLSGYQNPLRSQLRDSLLGMGAKYKGDWGKGCTHLICAFKNTPKYQAVKGKGKIVNEKWVQDCETKKIKFPWRRYSLEKSEDDEESEEEIWATEICPNSQKSRNQKVDKSGNNEVSDNPSDADYSEDTEDEIEKVLKENKDIKAVKKSPTKDQKSPPKKKPNSPVKSKSSDEDYDADTDIDEEVITKKDTSDLPLPSLKPFLNNKMFLLYEMNDESKRRTLNRYIVAHGGEVDDYMSERVNFVVTEDPWDEKFDEALIENSSLQFVKPQWIWKCCDKEKYVPPQPFLIVPLDNSD